MSREMQKEFDSNFELDKDGDLFLDKSEIYKFIKDNNLIDKTDDKISKFFIKMLTFMDDNSIAIISYFDIDDMLEEYKKGG